MTDKDRRYLLVEGNASIGDIQQVIISTNDKSRMSPLRRELQNRQILGIPFAPVTQSNGKPKIVHNNLSALKSLTFRSKL